jgi:TolB protein
VDGSAPKQVTSGHEDIGYPCWSRDGRWLAIEIKSGGQTHVAVLPSSGGTPARLTSGPGQNWPHSWAPDSDRIALAAERDGVWNVWSVSRRSRELVRLTSFDAAQGYVRYPAWSPDGRQIVFERSEAFGNLWAGTLGQDGAEP